MITNWIGCSAFALVVTAAIAAFNCWRSPHALRWLAARFMARAEQIRSSRLAWDDGLKHWEERLIDKPGPEIMKRDA